MMRTAATQPHLVFSRERPAEWLSLYRNSKALLARLGARFMEEHTASVAALVLQVIQTGELKRELFPEIQRGLDGFLAGMANAILDNPLTSFRPSDIDPMKLRQEIDYAFLGLVILPSVLRFDKLPTFLYARARRGDLEALCKLLVLDAGVLEDPRIRRRVFAIRQTGSAGERRKLACALDGKGFRYPSKKALKARFAGFLDKTFREADASAAKFMAAFPQFNIPQHRVLAPEFRAAFDAAAKDMSGQEIDLDLPADEAFYKLLQRAEGPSLLEAMSRTIRRGKMSG